MTKSFTVFLMLFVTALYASEPQTQTDARLRSYLQSKEDSGFGYSVLVSKNGKPVIENGYGWTNKSKKCKTTVHTLFNLASITKSFTAIAVFQLHKAGKVQLDDPLPKFFKDVPTDKQSITVQQLLVHTSGFQQNYAAERKKTRDEAVRALLADKLGFKPGSNFSYSNENYELLAAIIEVVTGETYESYVRKHILQKAGMSETKFWDEVDPRNNCAIASIGRSDVPVAKRDWGYIGSGGIYSNVLDLNRWFDALKDGALLDASEVAAMWKPIWKATSTQIASGWFVSETEGTTEIWTRGSEDWGHNGVVRWFPERKLLIIVQSNSGELGDKNTTANRLISDEIVQLLNGL